MENDENIWIAGFWKRIGAFFIDSLILGTIGFLLGLFLENYFVQIGGWGRLVGFSIALMYFGPLNSTLNKGQTIGKKLLKINVVDANNNFISVPKSFLRYSVLGIPFFLNNARFTDDLLFSPLLYLLVLIIFGGCLSIIYLYIFNRVTRQSLHDIIFGTYVTNSETTGTSTSPIWKPHYAVVAVLFIASGVTPYFTIQLTQEAPFSDMLNIRKIVMNEPVVVYANISEGTSFVSSSKTGKSKTTYISVQAFLATNDIENGNIARDIGNIIVNNHETALTKNIILVNLTYGYDLGIWSLWKNYNHRFIPSDLN